MATWQLDAAHSEVQFSVRHMMLSKVRGSFERVSGTVDFNESDPAQSSVDVTIEAASIQTKNEQRDAHLISPDFLNTEQFPTITFKSTSVEKVSENNGKITGDLTVRGVTKPVVLDVEYHGTAKSPWGSFSAGFSATTKISRKEWGLEWNVALETGGVLVGDEIEISIEIEIVKQVEETAEATA